MDLLHHPAMTGHGSEITTTGERPLVARELGLGLSAPLSERLMPLANAGKLLALVFGEGASFGMAVWLSLSDGLTQYAVNNELSMPDRRALLASMFGAGLLAVTAAIVFLFRARQRAAERLHRRAWQLSPLLLIGLAPLLLRWQIWVARETTFGVLVCVVGFLLHALLTRSAQASTEEADGMGQALARALSRAASRSERWAPPLIVGISALFYSLYFSYYTVAYHRSVLTMSYDLGLEDNLLWNLIHGNQFMKSAPLVGPHGSHFGFHATLFAYVIGIFYYFHQNAETLLVFQSFMIGCACVPLYLFAQARIGRWAAALLAVLYVLYPPVHGSNLYDFHYLPLGVFFLWLTLWLVDAGYYKWGALAVLLTLSIREDVAADLTVMGAFMLFAGRRPRAGLVVAGVAFVYFILIKMVIMPRFLHGSESFIHQWKDLVPAGGRGYTGVMMTVIGNPVYTLTSLLEPDKFLYLVQIGAPLCFLAWRRPLGYLLTVPGFFFTLLSTKYPPLVQISFQYTAHWTAFLFIGAVAALEWVRRPSFPGDEGGWRRQRVWLATACVTTVLTSYQYGAILQQNTAKGGFGKYKFETTAADRQRYADLKKLIAMVPPDAKITSSEYVVPHVSNRADAYTLRNGIYDAEYLLWETPARDDERTFVREALRDDFGVVASAGPFVLAKRGHSKDENQHWLKKAR